MEFILLVYLFIECITSDVRGAGGEMLRKSRPMRLKLDQIRSWTDTSRSTVINNIVHTVEQTDTLKDFYNKVSCIFSTSRVEFISDSIARRPFQDL